LRQRSVFGAAVMLKGVFVICWLSVEEMFRGFREVRGRVVVVAFEEAILLYSQARVRSSRGG